MIGSLSNGGMPPVNLGIAPIRRWPPPCICWYIRYTSESRLWPLGHEWEYGYHVYQALCRSNCASVWLHILEAFGVRQQPGIPGMLESIDCMHWSWKNCLVTWYRQFKGHKKDATIILEAMADMRLGFGMHSLECPGRAMISMFINDHHLWQGSHCVKVQWWSLKQIVTSTTMAIFLPTASTQGGKHLWSRFINPKVRNNPISQCTSGG
jgi:hypothetical protein